MIRRRVQSLSMVIVGILSVVGTLEPSTASDSAAPLGNTPAVQAAAAGPRHTFCVSCKNQGGTPTPFGFIRYELGLAAADWFPVDLYGQGTWQLAILAAGTPTRVGVFDAQAGLWIDGPRTLPVSAKSWGVGDWNGDGRLEYVWRSGSDLRYFDSRTLLDSLLWSVEYDVSQIFVWGSDSAGEPLVGFLHSVGLRTDSYSLSRYAWALYELRSGKLVGSVPGGLGTPAMIAGFRDGAQPVIGLYECTGERYKCPGPCGSSGYFEQRLHLCDRAWSPVWTGSLPGYTYNAGSSDLPRAAWGLSALGWVTSSKLGSGTLAWIVNSMDNNGVALPSYLGGVWFTGGVWTITLSDAYPAPASPSAYTSLAGLDVDDNGSEELILPLRNGIGWEVRSPANGVIVDTLKGRPAVYLANGPLLSADHHDLYYLADSGLYVWMHIPPPVAGDSDSADTLESAARLVAFPNPFNSTVRLAWSSTPGVSALDIFNILGRRVRTYDLSAVTGARSSIEWDGRDVTGHSVSSGLYFARLSGGRNPVVAKLILLK